MALSGAAFPSYVRLECHPCTFGIWSVLDNTGRQSQRGFIKLINGTYKGGRIYVAVVGENITAERDVRMEATLAYHLFDKFFSRFARPRFIACSAQKDY
ncbi:Uncharacterized protein DBV15_08285 [Temnothorax longispinosus]|uniref:Uncharacterized protein n=1 Tax=Temnothorax longispinosus TaxID=300112 RepID=A0A4S2KKS0_9HYME|nr:Uncharacterized protein DBV15_08285 [Temnothorax longispinosus]